MKKEMNNKGFSLVELIVVIAIMGILAVTLAPRLTQYIGRARTAADQDTMANMFSAAKLANAEFPLGDGVAAATIASDTAADTVMYLTTDGETWAVNADATNPWDASATTNEEFYTQFDSLIGEFKLSSTDASTDTTITLGTSAEGGIILTLDYDGSATTTDDRISLAE